MGVNVLFISGVSTALSLVGLQYYTEISLERHKLNGSIVDGFINLEDASRVLELLLGSYTTLALAACVVTNVFVLIILGLKGTYDQTVLEDAAWSLIPPNPSQAGTSRSPIAPATSVPYPRRAAGLDVRSTSHTTSTNGNLANIIAMAQNSSGSAATYA